MDRLKYVTSVPYAHSTVPFPGVVLIVFEQVCLFDAKEISLRDEMRMGATDGELLQLIGNAVFGKKEKHAGMEDIDVVTNRPMILIGG